jgi:diguanylate cyclase (GGDEF)-like protein
MDSMIKQNLLQSNIGLAIINLDGIIISANPAFCRIFAFADAVDVDGNSLINHVESKFPAAIAGLAQTLKSHEATTIEFRLTRDSEMLSMHLDDLNIDQRMVYVHRLTKPALNAGFPNIAEQIDALTGLGNRILLDQVISNWKPGGEEALSLAVIMIDLDRFKQVNDTLGHGAGDTLLKLAAKRIKSAARENDLVIRLGGDEFVVLHTIGMQPVGASSVANRIVELMSRPFIIDGQQVNIGASVGIAALGHGTDTSVDLLRHADLALYEAKAAGRGVVKFFEPSLALRAQDKREIEIELRRALGLKQFKLVYQPQIIMAGGVLEGFEALIRWHHPVRGDISPTEFIPLTESTGEIHAIGEWILRTACKEAMTWEGELSIAVNVSPIQFDNERIIDVVKNALASSGLPARRLELEITEGVLMKNVDNVQKILWAIKDMGVGIAMDDFGTGYSSLSYLNSFPFTKIKIDQSFVRVEHSEKSKALVNAIISLGASLNMKTIAEGVETEEQFKELAAGGCIAAQGFLISKPIDPTAIAAFIATLSKKIKSSN